MDLNAYVDKAIKSGIEAQKDQLIKQTLKEDHDYIMFKLHKIFGGTYKHIENILKKYNGDYATESEEVLNILATMMDDVEEAVTGNKKCNCDGKCAVCKCKQNKEIEEDNDLIMLEEVPVDKQKRLTIPWKTISKANFVSNHVELVILKSKEEDNIFYIVDKEFNYDINRLEFVKNVPHIEWNALRIGIGKLLNVKAGDIVGVDVYDKQLVVYNTGSNVDDLTDEDRKDTVSKLINDIREKIKNGSNNEPEWLRIYKIEF